jgi:hypothetical protein
MDFSLNLTFQGFLQICPENSGFIKIWQEQKVLYMKIPVNLYLLQWEMFQKKVVEKINTHI